MIPEDADKLDWSVDNYQIYNYSWFVGENSKGLIAVELDIAFCPDTNNLYDLASLPNEIIYSGGYVVETMETVLWALMNTDNYRDCVLTCVNMGYDADSTAAIAGGLAGLYYGYDSIQAEWIEALVNKELIDECIKGLEEYVNAIC